MVNLRNGSLNSKLTAKLSSCVEIVFWYFCVDRRRVEKCKWNVLKKKVNPVQQINLSYLGTSDALFPFVKMAIFRVDNLPDSAVEGIEQAASCAAVVVKLSVAILWREHVEQA